jgi:Tol biopolymer transport system component
LTKDKKGIDDLAAWSPDGRLIAFVSAAEENNYDIWVMNSDGSNPVNLTETSNNSYTAPRWSQDSEYLIFPSPFPASKGIWKAKVDSSSLVRLTSPYPERNDLNSEWSPVENRIITVDSISGDIWIMDADGSNLANITSTSEEFDGVPMFSSDGRLIVFSCGLNICIMEKDGSNRTDLTHDGGVQGGKLITNTYPKWSPTGDQIVYTSTRTGNSDIWIMDADGLNPVNLTSSH